MKTLGVLLRDQNGATIVEFAMLAPAMLLMLLGLFDISYNFYVQAQMQGAIQQAARNSGIEGADGKLSTIDARVTEAVHAISPDALVSFTRKSYASFTEVRQAEDFTDIDGNGICNNGETFEDANGNGTWDTDRGKEGLGAARDAVLYIVDVEYESAFHFPSFIGLSDTVNMQTSTVLRNQPYSSDNSAIKSGSCL